MSCNLNCSSGERNGRLNMKRQVLAVVAGVAGFAPMGAFAHHPMSGLPMETFTHGLLSGIGHPILGFFCRATKFLGFFLPSTLYIQKK